MALDAITKSREFWDEKAAENPFWYVSSYSDYSHPDVGQFWASGVTIWCDLKAATGYTPAPSDTIVEIGCGIGRLTRAIAPDARSVLALDISDNMLNFARRSAPANVSFQHVDGNCLANVADSTADAAIAYCVFQHLPDIDALGRYLREMFRVTKPGALIAFTLTPKLWRDRPIFARALNARRKIKEWISIRGPRGLYRMEWYGIRPSHKQVMELSPLPLTSTLLYGDKLLYYGRKP